MDIGWQPALPITWDLNVPFMTIIPLVLGTKVE